MYRCSNSRLAREYAAQRNDSKINSALKVVTPSTDLFQMLVDMNYNIIDELLQQVPLASIPKQIKWTFDIKVSHTVEKKIKKKLARALVM